MSVALLDCSGHPIIGPDGNPVAATTDANGKYLFDGLEEFGERRVTHRTSPVAIAITSSPGPSAP
ncbi:hypothetical protein DMC61_11315 [Amycolatopsis sp. WAC 04169]|uniref:hypothetical protein n=1 Tax=Amycolatopsis sp. WAC 04169 TaxID=2203197 RepID=UPI000F7AB22A|nr:hypothetical protein [Amycolatopsis sp. WAC 04169]RSN32771.1 hypothetical protein DMC61_11315 [Amycolatopsis sp. WAC 04169]